MPEGQKESCRQSRKNPDHLMFFGNFGKVEIIHFVWEYRRKNCQLV